MLRQLIWAIAWSACSVAIACHDAPKAPPEAPKAAEPAVIVVEDVPAENDEPPPAPAGNAASDSGPIKVGIVHSLSGTMSLIGAPARQIAEMTVARINAEGGVLGRAIEPVVVDPASDWPLFAEKAKEVLVKEDVAVIFGGETSVSRKSMLPVLEELGGLLFYPASFEGEELSCNVFYTGMTPSQQSIPALEYLMSREGGGYRRFVFLGTDYVLPRTTFRLLTDYAEQHGLTAKQIMSTYTPFGHSDYGSVVSDIARFGRGSKTAIVAALWGESAAAFHGELARQGLRTKVLHLSLDEYQIKSDSVRPYIGSLTARGYLANPGIGENARFEQEWRKYLTQVSPESPAVPPIEDIMEATYVGIRLWKLAVERAGSTELEPLRKALPLVKLEGPMGVELAFDKNHFLARPLFIGALRADGAYDVLWRSAGALPPEPFSRFNPDSSREPNRVSTQLELCGKQ